MFTLKKKKKSCLSSDLGAGSGRVVCVLRVPGTVSADSE